MYTSPVRIVETNASLFSPGEPESIAHSGGLPMAGPLGVYRVWIANLAAPDSNNRWSAAARKDACDALRGLFTRVIENPACHFTFCDWFLFEPQTSVLAPGELLVYILASSRNSIINRQSTQQIDPDAAGNTIPVNGRVISEIYLGERPHHPGNSTLGDNHYTQLIANVAFHELMHNKLDALPVGQGGVMADLHASGGGGLARGGQGARPIEANTQLSPTNISFMAQNLGRAVPQFVGGVQNLVITNGMPSQVDRQPAPTP